jgi:hypothetical protein
VRACCSVGVAVAMDRNAPARERDDMQEAGVGWDAIDVRIVTIDEVDDGWA